MNRLIKMATMSIGAAILLMVALYLFLNIFLVNLSDNLVLFFVATIGFYILAAINFVLIIMAYIFYLFGTLQGVGRNAE